MFKRNLSIRERRNCYEEVSTQLRQWPEHGDVEKYCVKRVHQTDFNV